MDHEPGGHGNLWQQAVHNLPAMAVLDAELRVCGFNHAGNSHRSGHLSRVSRITNPASHASRITHHASLRHSLTHVPFTPFT